MMLQQESVMGMKKKIYSSCIFPGFFCKRCKYLFYDELVHWNICMMNKTPYQEESDRYSKYHCEFRIIQEG